MNFADKILVMLHWYCLEILTIKFWNNPTLCLWPIFKYVKQYVARAGELEQIQSMIVKIFQQY